MLASEQFRVLESLYACPGHSENRHLFLSRLSPDDQQRLFFLVSSGLIRDSLRNLDLTAKGLAAMDEYRSALEQERRRCAEREAEERLRQQSEDKRQRNDARRSWVQWTITTILSVLSFFAGAVTEELTGFVQWIASLFH